MSNENENLAQRVARLESENERLRQQEGPSDSEWMDSLVAESDAGTKTPGGLPSAIAKISNSWDDKILREEQRCAGALRGLGGSLDTFKANPENPFGKDVFNYGNAVAAQLGMNPSLVISRLQAASTRTPEELQRNLGGEPIVIHPPRD